jgi:hypothetical protein
VLTLAEIKEKLIQQVDEVDIVDFLGLTTEDIVNAFEDIIEENPEKFLKLLDFDDEDMVEY